MRLLIFILLAFANTLFAQSGMLNGSVLNEKTNQVLVGANISINEIFLNTTTNLSGNFAFTNIPVGNYTLTVSHIGYNTKTDSFVIQNGKNLYK